MPTINTIQQQLKAVPAYLAQMIDCSVPTAQQAQAQTMALVFIALDHIMQTRGAAAALQLLDASSLQNFAQDEDISAALVYLARDSGRPLLDKLLSDEPARQRLLLQFAMQHGLALQPALDVFQAVSLLTVRALALDAARPDVDAARWQAELSAQAQHLAARQPAALLEAYGFDPYTVVNITSTDAIPDIRQPASVLPMHTKIEQSFWSQFALHGGFLLLIAIPIVVFWTSCSTTKQTSQERQFVPANPIDSGMNDTSRPVAPQIDSANAGSTPTAPAAHEIIPHQWDAPTTLLPQGIEPPPADAAPR